jgi:hypothetical protein
LSNRAHRARRDTSEAEIVRALEVCGYKTIKLAQKGVPDLLVWRLPTERLLAGVPHLIECKTGKGQLRETQDWEGQGLAVTIMRSAEDVFSWHMGHNVRMAK